MLLPVPYLLRLYSLLPEESGEPREHSDCCTAVYMTSFEVLSKHFQIATDEVVIEGVQAAVNYKSCHILSSGGSLDVLHVKIWTLWIPARYVIVLLSETCVSGVETPTPTEDLQQRKAVCVDSLRQWFSWA